MALPPAEGTGDLAARVAALEAENAALRERLARKSDVLAVMSHELRTPLNAILGYGELLQDYGADRLSRRHRRALDSMVEGARHLLGIINDMLDLSKIQAGRMDLNPGLLATRGVLERVVGLVQGQAEAKGVYLEAEVAPRAEVAYGDARRVEQALLNLVGNALKFTPAGGRVTVIASPHAEGVLFTIADTGPGIAAADQARLFEEFTTLGDPATRAVGGTGLGLALTKRLAELHHGRVWCESEPGHGAAFHLLLPSPRERPRGRDVLLVDADAGYRAATAAVLRQAGLEPVEAAGAEAALAYLGGSRPGAVVLDLNLAGTHGLDLAARLRERAGTRDVPLVFLAGAALPEAERAARHRFQAAWVPKGPEAWPALLAELTRLGLGPGAPSPQPGPQAPALEVSL